ncbi:MAG TPA: flagellar hook-associated protein FlgL [Burkholderiales bacterium]|nr:flagellar hook-associated protein FlgL [Burkholderiales bacterium]
MRISTNTVYDLGLAQIQNQESRLLNTQQQISSGKRILTPADDPIAAAQALEVQQSIAVNSQYQTNQQVATNTLALTNSALTGVTNLIQSVRETAVSAGNGVLSDSDKATLAQQLQQDYQQLLTLANSDDGQGHYLFAGFQSGVQPFAQTPAGVAYLGDAGQRLIQTNAASRIAANLPGSDVFMNIRNGNGTFIAQPAAANAGSGVITQGTVADPTALTGDSYQINFTVTTTGSATTTTYDVVDATTGTTLATAQPYTSGNAISFDGMQVNITGDPADGDQFTVTPSANQSIFQTISDLIGALQAPASGTAADARFANSLGLALSNLDQALTSLNGQSGAVGARLTEISDLTGASQSLDTQYQQTLSQLQDVDYAKAATDLAKYQTTLQAAQQSFQYVAGNSLFDYL